jgi:hypothetical protein
MPVSTKSNVPQHESLRWNLRKAAVEFSTTVDTLTKSLNQISASPDPDGLFSTAQLVQALFGQLHVEKVRTQRQIADRYTLDNQITRGEMLNRSELMRGLSAIADAMTARIMASELSREVKQDLLKELSSVPITLQEVADRQTKLRRAGNGQTDGSES